MRLLIWRWVFRLFLAVFAYVPFLAVAGPTPPSPAAPLAWSTLAPNQQAILVPLSKDWEQISPESRKKWLEVANRLPNMSADQQARVRERMAEWARMTPAQRGEARVNFQQSKQIEDVDRQERWQAYKALPDEEKRALVEKARPAVAAASASGLIDARRPYLPIDAQTPKSNRVDSATTFRGSPKVVTPTVIQGNPGATTTLVTKLPSPPSHLKPGQPKIAAGPEVVDPATLLPRKSVPELAPKPTQPASSNASADATGGATVNTNNPSSGAQ